MTYKLYTLNGEFTKDIDTWPDNFNGIVECVNYSKHWVFEGKYHRLDGPAFEHFNGEKHWFIFGIQYTKEAHDLYVDMMKLKELFK